MSDQSCAEGVCRVEPVKNAGAAPELNQDTRVIYVGDPMCSWCYGVSPVVNDLQQYCTAHDIRFEIVVGGLRAGGGDQWNEGFIAFLRNEWGIIADKTGVEFNFGILDQDYFNYNTEQSCRAVVIARSLLPDDNNALLTAFFKGIQTKFYLYNEDPKEVSFYENLCAEAGIDFSAFKTCFEDREWKKRTIAEFRYRSQLGVNSFPSFLLVKGDKVTLLAAGYATLLELVQRIK